MAKIITSNEAFKLDLDGKPDLALWLYNGLDCCATFEIRDAIKPLLDDYTRLIYKFELAQRSPALEMMLRGIAVDQFRLVETVLELEKDLARLDYILQQYAHAVWDAPLNPQSPAQMIEFFYGTMQLPPEFSVKKGVRKISTDREQLEKLYAKHRIARPIIKAILAYRDCSKRLGFLRSGIDADHRIRCSFSIAGTETGRWSSSKNIFGRGTNLQNITEKMRRVFVADPGMKIAYVDLEQAESRGVAYLSGDPAYIHACESGDLHTTVCRMVWENLAWTDDNDKNKSVAEAPYYREYSYRDMAKRGGHGSNYLGQPFTMARHLKVDTKVMEHFQQSYFTAFPGIPAWHKQIARDLQLNLTIITPSGRKRIFFDRPTDPATLRQAVAFQPQSLIADALNFGMWKVWKKYPGKVQLLAQIHDAILFQYAEELEEEILAEVLSTILVPINRWGRTLTIPTEAMVGWNWGKVPKKNPQDNSSGLVKWKGKADVRNTKAQKRQLDLRVS